jgi:hypothetical protein
MMPHSQIGGKLLKRGTFQAIFPSEKRLWDFPRELRQRHLGKSVNEMGKEGEREM